MNGGEGKVKPFIHGKGKKRYKSRGKGGLKNCGKEREDHGGGSQH